MAAARLLVKLLLSAMTPLHLTSDRELRMSVLLLYSQSQCVHPMSTLDVARVAGGASMAAAKHRPMHPRPICPGYMFSVCACVVPSRLLGMSATLCLSALSCNLFGTDVLGFFVQTHCDHPAIHVAVGHCSCCTFCDGLIHQYCFDCQSIQSALGGWSDV